MVTERKLVTEVAIYYFLYEITNKCVSEMFGQSGANHLYQCQTSPEDFTTFFHSLPHLLA